MDGRAFDALARSLAARPSRRALLAGLAGAAFGRAGAAAAAPKPKPCLPEGKKTKDPGRCCSKITADGRCCGEEFGACETSGCCDPGSTTPICHDGGCVACLPEGTPAADPDACCGKAVDRGVCCGEPGGSCAVGGCCGGGEGRQFCVAGTCVGCLPEGYPSANPGDCCSLALGDGVCCGGPGGSCAQSGCCSGPEEICDNGECVPCLPEGAPSTDPARCCGKAVGGGLCRAEGCLPDGALTADASLCCSLLRSGGRCVDCYPEATLAEDPLDCCSGAADADGSCCGQGSCLESGCCAPGLSCCNGVCLAACADACTLADNTPDPACTTAGGVFGRRCCTGVCCPLGDVCVGGVCVGDDCTLSNPNQTPMLCPTQTRCVCRAPNGPPNPGGCVCCPRCPAGSANGAYLDCKGGCGDCCVGCTPDSGAGGYVCAGG